MINKNHVKKRQKYDGIKKMSSSVIQAKMTRWFLNQVKTAIEELEVLEDHHLEVR